MYEDKRLEAYISKLYGFPFANTYISNDKTDALRLIENLKYPVVSKIDPSSGSAGVELIHTLKDGQRIIEQAFSNTGRKTYTNHFRQKNHIYFQDFIPNDGYDIRIIAVGSYIFGYYRKVLEGDFKASGMNMVEKRELPEEVMKIAIKVNDIVQSPMLVVDFVHSLDDKYYIIEFSPICQMEFLEQLHVKGAPGVYIYDNGFFHFEKERYRVHELALSEFLVNSYLPSVYKAHAL